jgi:hypothetical protein
MFWHRHKWKITGVCLMKRSTCIVGLFTPMTEVLRVCDCGEASTFVLDGHWELEQLQPHPAGAAADAEFFKKLGVKL